MIRCDFLLDNDDEPTVGVGLMPHAPRVGELIWLQFDQGRDLLEYVVKRVAYHVPDCRCFRAPVECASCAVYVDKV